MFRFLKEKLKSVIGRISKKVEEEIKIEGKAEGKAEEKAEEKIVEKAGKKAERVAERVAERIKEEKEVRREPVKKVKKEEEKIEEKVQEKTEDKKEEGKEVEEKKEKKGFFERIKEKITTTKISVERFSELFSDLEIVMLENNVAYDVVQKIKDDLGKRVVDKPIKRGEVVNAIRENLKESIKDLFLSGELDLVKEVRGKKGKPFVVAFFGVNGGGKTTTIWKVASLLKGKGFSVVLGAGDSFRAASIQQLEELGKRVGAKVIKHDYGSDPAAICFDTVKYGREKKIDVVLLDTAGRQHSNVNLMEQMKKIVRVVKPDLKIFVGESIAGSDVVEQARSFNEIVGIDGIILTKADVDEKGGAMISVEYVTGKPILYLGVGQMAEDLEMFDVEKIVKGIGL